MATLLDYVTSPSTPTANVFLAAPLPALGCILHLLNLDSIVTEIDNTNYKTTTRLSSIFRQWLRELNQAPKAKRRLVLVACVDCDVGPAWTTKAYISTVQGSTLALSDPTLSSSPFAFNWKADLYENFPPAAHAWVDDLVSSLNITRLEDGVKAVNKVRQAKVNSVIAGGGEEWVREDFIIDKR
jgi:hypothetical protein